MVPCFISSGESGGVEGVGLWDIHFRIWSVAGACCWYPSTCVKLWNSSFVLSGLLSSVPAPAQHCLSLWIEKKLNFNFLLLAPNYTNPAWNLQRRNDIMEDYWWFVQIGFFLCRESNSRTKKLMDPSSSWRMTSCSPLMSCLASWSCQFLVWLW